MVRDRTVGRLGGTVGIGAVRSLGGTVGIGTGSGWACSRSTPVAGLLEPVFLGGVNVLLEAFDAAAPGDVLVVDNGAASTRRASAT